jgi:plastocyanin
LKARLTTSLLALLAGALVAAGCGGSDTEDAGDPGPAQNPPAETETDTEAKDTTEGKGGGDQQVRNDADASGQLRFEKATLETKAGQVTLVMKNPSPVPHAIAVRGDGADESGETVEKGGTSQVTADLKPGEYEFYCPVPGHEEGGMKGTLEVK